MLDEKCNYEIDHEASILLIRAVVALIKFASGKSPEKHLTVR